MLLSFELASPVEFCSHEASVSDVENVTSLKDQNHLFKESWESFDYDPSRLYKLVEDHGKKLFFFYIFIFRFPFRQEAAASDRQVKNKKRDRPEKSVAWRTQRSDRGELHALCKTSSSQVSFKPESGEQGDLETGHCANVVKSAR